MDSLRVGVDVGGTFTDVVIAREKSGEIISLKVPTLPDNLLQGILNGLGKAAGMFGIELEQLLENTVSFVHGTTVCTNLMVQRKGARVGLLTTEGFRDSLAIRRGRRESIWNMKAASPIALVPRNLRLEIQERMDTKGKPLIPPETENILSALDIFKQENVEAIAICLFNAFANGEHEKIIRDAAMEVFPNIPILTSSEVLPVMGEYERVSTTVINAYVSPGATSYLNTFSRTLQDKGLGFSPLIMHGNGGVTDIPGSVQKPGSLILSGPAAGAAATAWAGKLLGTSNLIIFDMGGTSCDVSVTMNGEIPVFDGMEIEGYHLAAPSLEIHTIGTGGGTIATVDPGGMLHVGPQAAGAVPGPVAYGRGGEEPTVTDAHLILGKLESDNLSESGITLDRGRAESAIRFKIAEPLGISIPEAAMAIVKIANQNMISAIELMSVQKGRDPRNFVLIAAGGGGPLHACAVARDLGISRVFVPRHAAVLSALGLLHADLRRDYVQNFQGRIKEISTEKLQAVLRRMRDNAIKDIGQTDISAIRINNIFQADLRYEGQHWDIPVEIPDLDCNEVLDNLSSDFHKQHEVLYGHWDPDGEIEFTNLRLAAIVPTPSVSITKPAMEPPLGKTLPHGNREVLLDGNNTVTRAPVFRGSSLSEGFQWTGPALIEEKDTVIWLETGDSLKVDADGNYHIQIHSTLEMEGTF